MIFAEPIESLTPRQRNVAIALGVAIALTRLLAVSRSLWDWDEALFTMGVRGYDVTQHHPHPPGYPLFVLAAKLVHFIVRDELRSLQVVVVLAAMALFPALFALARELRFPFPVAASGAALFAFFPNVWFYGGTALSDVPSLALVVYAAALLLRGCRERGAYFAGALVLGLAAGVRPQNLLIGAAPALIATWCRRRAWREVIGAISIGAAVIVASYAGAAFASSSWREYLDACATQSRYLHDVDSYHNPGRPPLLRLLRPIVVDPMHAGGVDVLLTALAALGFLIALRRPGTRVLVAMFVPIQLFTWLMLDFSNFPRYSVSFLPMYALLIACAFVWMRAWAALPVALVAARLIVWVLPALNEVRRHDSPVAAAFRSVRASPTVYAHEGVGPFAEVFLPKRNVIVGRESELPFADVPYLREGRTMLPGARMFRRSRSSHLSTFVRMHYFEVSVMPARAARIFGDGWYGEETDGEQVWDWMAGRGTLLLPPAGPHARLTLHFRIPSNVAAAHPLLTLHLNGALVGRWPCTSEEMTGSFVAPARTNATNELTLEIAPVFNPMREHLSGDDRDLGLQLFAFDWRSE